MGAVAMDQQVTHLQLLFFEWTSAIHTLGDLCLHGASLEDSRASVIAMNTLEYAPPHPYKYLGSKCPLSVVLTTT